MEFHGSTLLSDWILADIHLDGVPGVPAVNIFWHTEGVLAVFPLHGTRYRVIADVGESSGTIGDGHRPTPTVEDVQRTLDARGPGGIQASDPVWLSSFSINETHVFGELIEKHIGLFFCGLVRATKANVYLAPARSCSHLAYCRIVAHSETGRRWSSCANLGWIAIYWMSETVHFGTGPNFSGVE